MKKAGLSVPFDNNVIQKLQYQDNSEIITLVINHFSINQGDDSETQGRKGALGDKGLRGDPGESSKGLRGEKGQPGSPGENSDERGAKGILKLTDGEFEN